MMVRNAMNFSKFMIMNYGEKNIKGEYDCSKVKREFSKPTYQKYYLFKYGILTNTSHDYLKCYPLNYNLKFLFYFQYFHFQYYCLQCQFVLYFH